MVTTVKGYVRGGIKTAKPKMYPMSTPRVAALKRHKPAEVPTPPQSKLETYPQYLPKTKRKSK
jgi:hypothetical protein